VNFLVPNSLIEILKTCESNGNGQQRFPPTEVFNEGWMLRLLLDALQTVDVRDPLGFLEGAMWYSEARLSSPFCPTKRQDPLGESFTHADGIIGNFEFRKKTKTGFKLTDGARQFIVLEAKMFSNLSCGTKNALGYNQAARNVACMAKTIEQSGIRLDDFKSVGFFVLAPNREMRARRKRNTNLETCLQPVSIRSAVSKRIESYPPEKQDELRLWEKQYFLPLVNRLESEHQLKVLSWEEIIESIAVKNKVTGEVLHQFYDQCLKYA
jgi:hypothetical protein